MVATVLLLGGTAEARELAALMAADPAVALTSSLAGRVRDPALPAGAVRVGGFGGVAGLREWLHAHRVAAVIDATHPFAATITRHAAAACAEAGVPILHLRRPGWSERPGDRWTRVPTLAAAAAHAATAGTRILLTIGRQGVEAFAPYPEPWFVIRAIDPPTGPVPPRCELLLARGPFTVADETRLLAEHDIDVLVTKDSGGAHTAAKLAAARARGIPVVMIDRPPPPSHAHTADSVPAALAWFSTLLSDP